MTSDHSPVRPGPVAALRHRPAVPVATAATALAAIAYLIGPPTGHDLAAQIAHADFVRAHGLTPIDFRWFGGVSSLGYSLWSGTVMAYVGVRLTGAIATVACAALTTVLFQRHGARRPLLGGLVAGACQVLSLVDGRVTFELGAAVALGALVVGTGPGRPAIRVAGTAVLAFLATTGSPVAGLFLLVAAAGFLAARQLGSMLALGGGVAAGLAIISGLFGDGGWEPFGAADFRDAVISTAVVLLVVPRRLRALRFAALVALAMLVIAYLVHTPVGNNAVRLSALFAVPVVVAFVEGRRVLVVGAVLLTVWPQQVSVTGAFHSGPPAQASYYAPVLRAIQDRGTPQGRVEVPETFYHGDDAYLARNVLLARGWLRQTDVLLNDHVFFTGSPSVAVYSAWLDRNAVQYVAVPDAKTTDVGKNELRTIARSPRLTVVWHNAHWRLYAVAGYHPVVAAPATAVSLGAAGIGLTVPAGRSVAVAVRYWRWYRLDTDVRGACLARAADGSVTIRGGAGGRMTLTSALTGDRHRCT